MKHLFIAVISLLYVSSAFSEMQVDDFFGDLERFYFSKPKRDFKEFSPCKATATFAAHVTGYRVQCTLGPGGFGTACRGITIFDENRVETIRVARCEEDEHVLLSSVFGVQRLSRENYLSYGHNLTEFALKRIKEFLKLDATIKIRKARQQGMTLNRGKPNQKRIQVTNFFGDVEFKDFDHTAPFMLTLSHDTPGMAHVVRFKMEGDLWLYLKDFTY